MTDTTDKASQLRDMYADVMIREKVKQRSAFDALDRFLKGEMQYLSFERTRQGAIVIKKHPEVVVEVVR